MMTALHHSVAITGNEQGPRTRFLAPHERVLGTIPLSIWNRAAPGGLELRCSLKVEMSISGIADDQGKGLGS